MPETTGLQNRKQPQAALRSMYSDTSKIAVAATVKVQFGNDRFTGQTRLIEKPVPQDRWKTMDLVRKLFPGKGIEHLGRKEMVKLKGRDPATSSQFFQAMHLAFADHHAFGLRPEVLMYLVNAVIAETVRRHPEDYRSLFTASAEKADVCVRHDGLVLGDPNSRWFEAINQFEEPLRQFVPASTIDNMLPAFTTATPESNAATLVAFMDAASPFYDYHVYTRCGIPRIVLFGDATDYRKLVVAVQNLSGIFGKHLSEYFTHLMPVLEKIALTAEGKESDEDFWSQMYKLHEHSGSRYFNGWSTAFLWYINNVSSCGKTSELTIKDPLHVDWKNMKGGPNSGSEPTHVSSVPFKWHYEGNQVFSMEFIGGILGVEVEEDALTPQLSYGILRA